MGLRPPVVSPFPKDQIMTSEIEKALENAPKLVEALRLQVRYASETQEQAALRNIRERQQAADLIEALTTLHAEGYREGAEAMREAAARVCEAYSDKLKLRAELATNGAMRGNFEDFADLYSLTAADIRALPAPQKKGGEQ